ncbi:hypothetical protein D9758_016310 [Tetrapyrgos nigripes]|uniref:Uncharacterized protein n=1 Tax=Tetrapyrgos nigripes TaxID=182062 RepID=A0A8H5CK86_9AGAR|nr:hypothetical protein D9758_016310 [Tetrapyrgos nigripes]
MVLSSSESAPYLGLIVSLALTGVLYGAYGILFVICMYIIRCRKGTVGKAHQIALIFLFALATLGFIFGCIESTMGVSALGSVQALRLVSEDTHTASITTQTIVFGLYTLANTIADIVLIQRCYRIWGFKKRIIVFPAFISAVNNGLALVRTIAMVNDQVQDINSLLDTMEKVDGLGATTFKSFIGVNFFMNLLLPLMMAGRIWWIARQASKCIAIRKNSLTLSRLSLAVCLESGIIYPVALLPPLVIYLRQDIYRNAIFINLGGDLIPILIQVVGIAPTFIIVRVALGTSIENVQDTIAREHAATVAEQESTGLATTFVNEESAEVSA